MARALRQQRPTFVEVGFVGCWGQGFAFVTLMARFQVENIALFLIFLVDAFVRMGYF
jgi:hypothetical protein